MPTRSVPTLALALALGATFLLAQQPGDPDYDPDPDVLQWFEELGEGGSDYDVDDEAFEEAQVRAAGDPPDPDPPSDDEVKQFRGALESHWGGNLPALLAYLNSLDPGVADNPDPPEEGTAGGWHPSADYDRFGQVIETAEEKRRRWRRRVERRLEELAGL